MAREILFKAKTFDNEWVEGYLYIRNDGVYEISRYDKELEIERYTNYVRADTLCQYTGLTDKNGNKIWENDVVFVTDDEGRSGQVDTGVGEIDFLEGLWYISGNVQNALYDNNNCFLIEVIGNIFDNPELLGGGE